MDTNEKVQIKLAPNEKFGIEIFRTDGGVDLFCEKSEFAKLTVLSWIKNETDPSRPKRTTIEQFLPGMKFPSWKMEHTENLTICELLYVTSIRMRMTDAELAAKSGLSIYVIRKALSGANLNDEYSIKKIKNLLTKLLGVVYVEGQSAQV